MSLPEFLQAPLNEPSDLSATSSAAPSLGRVLIVDDEESIRELMQLALEKAGFEVLALGDSSEVEVRAQEWKPDLILCDVLMPGRDGLAVFADLRANPRTCHVPVVLVTAKHFAGDQRSALEAGVAGYLVKPFDIASLVEIVSQALSSMAGVRIWGCRGSIATPEHAAGRFGGNTSCVELVLPAWPSQGRRRVIFDAGTGVRALGNAISESPVRAVLCLTHFHWDHVQGLPFFKPLYQAGNQITIFGPGASDTALVETIREQMGGAFFPISTEAFRASTEYHGLQEQEFEAEGLSCSTFSVMHPGFTLAYKVSWQGRSVVYCSDNELSPSNITQAEGGRPVLEGEVARFAEWLRGTDILLHDCQYGVAEYEKRRGWGHSNTRALAALVVAAGVRQVILFHHDPDHSDEQLHQMHAEFRAHLEAMAPDQAPTIRSQMASEGLFVAL